MIHHPVVLIPKLIVLIVILVVLVILHGVLTPDEFRLAVWIALGTFAVFCIVLWIVVLRMLRNPDSRLARSSVLSHRASPGDGASASSGPFEPLVGRQGVAVTPLNPSGKAEFDGKRVVVLADGEFVGAGRPVEVVHVRGTKVLVVEVRGSPVGEEPPAKTQGNAVTRPFRCGPESSG